MRKQSKRHTFQTIRLQLEGFERRDLLSGIRPLLNLSLSAPSLAAPVAVQTNDLAGDSLTITTAAPDSPTNSTTSSSQSSDVQPQSSSTNSATAVSAGSIGDAADGSVSSLTPIVVSSPTAPVTPVGSDTPSSGPLATTVAVGTSVALSAPVSVVAELVDFDTLAPLETLRISDSSSSQSGTVGGSNGQSTPSQDDGSPASSVASVPIQSTVGSSSTDDSNGDASGVAPLPSVGSTAVPPTVSTTANAGSGTAPNGSTQPRMFPGASTTAVLAPSESASARARQLALRPWKGRQERWRWLDLPNRVQSQVEPVRVADDDSAVLERLSCGRVKAEIGRIELLAAP